MEKVKEKKLNGLRFRCQHPIGNFILDFYCPSRKLVIEIDGEIHKERTEYDIVRTSKLEEYGYRVIRFSNERVINDLQGVLDEIEQVAFAS